MIDKDVTINPNNGEILVNGVALTSEQQEELNDIMEAEVTAEIDKLIVEDIKLVAEGKPVKNLGKTLFPIKGLKDEQKTNN